MKVIQIATEVWICRVEEVLGVCINLLKKRSMVENTMIFITCIVIDANISRFLSRTTAGISLTIISRQISRQSN